MKCIVHIGTEKTGTTLLQEWMYENEAAFSAHGVALLRSTDFPNNRKLASMFFLKPDDYLKSKNLISPKEQEKFYADFKKEFKQELQEKSKSHDTVLLTSEHFHSRLSHKEQIENLKEFLDGYFDAYQIVCYFREQSQMRVSAFSTALKAGNARTLKDYKLDISPNNHYYNYHRSFSKWKDVFGLEALSPRMYQRSSFVKNDIRHDFLKTILPNYDSAQFAFNKKSSNKSLSEPMAFFFSTVNFARPRFPKYFLDPTSKFVRNTIANQHAFNSIFKLSDRHHQEIYKKFNQSNVEFFATFFGQRKNLFKRPNAFGEAIQRLKNLIPQYMRYSRADVANLLTSLLKETGLIYVEKNESDELANLAQKISKDKNYSDQELKAVLKILERANQGDASVEAQIESLLKMDKS